MPPVRPTIADVARMAGVSKGAVSFALNDRPGVAAATRTRILEVAAELGWTPSHRARALSSSRALTVGLVLARLPETLSADPFFPAFIAGIESSLSSRGQALLLQVVPDEESERRSYALLAGSGRVDGVFLTDLRVDDPRPNMLAELGLPAVVVAPTAVAGPWPTVTVDDRPGVAAAVAHLVDLGHRRIGHVSGPPHFVHTRSRQGAWAQALAAAGLEAQACESSDLSPAGGAAATLRLLGRPDPPTAIVYGNDLMAIAGLSAAQARGVRVPTELSVTGFDDSLIAAHIQPPLTTVRADVVNWGRAAADCLLRLVEATPVDGPKVERPSGTCIALPPSELVVRASTAPPLAAAATPGGPSAHRTTPASRKESE